MSLSFRYKTIQRPMGDKIRGPWIPLTLYGPDAIIDTMAFLDSGADYTVFPIELAEIIGLDIKKGSKNKCKGIGGEVNSILTTVSVNISKGHESYTMDLPSYIIIDEGSDVPPLIGRAVFFDEFKITFDQPLEKVVLKKVNPKNYFGETY